MSFSTARCFFSWIGLLYFAYLGTQEKKMKNNSIFFQLIFDRKKKALLLRSLYDSSHLKRFISGEIPERSNGTDCNSVASASKVRILLSPLQTLRV